MTSEAALSPEKTETVQLSVRVETGLVERLDALVPALAQPGMAITRADVTRMALLRGLAAMEQEAKRRK